MSHGNQPCRKTRLAESPMATIELCSCGTISLNIGPATVRLTTSALDELSSVVREALSHRALAPSAQPVPIPPGLLRGSDG